MSYHDRISQTHSPLTYREAYVLKGRSYGMNLDQIAQALEIEGGSQTVGLILGGIIVKLHQVESQSKAVLG